MWCRASISYSLVPALGMSPVSAELVWPLPSPTVPNPLPLHPPLGEPLLSLFLWDRPPLNTPASFPKKRRKKKRSQEGPNFVTISLWIRAGPEHPQTQGSVISSRAQQLCTGKQQETGWCGGISQACHFCCLHYLQILQNQSHLQRKQWKGKATVKKEVMQGQKHQIFTGRRA